MRVAVSVINHGLLLNALFCNGQINVNEAVVGGRSGERGDLQRVQRFAGVAIGHFCQVTQRGFVGSHFEAT